MGKAVEPVDRESILNKMIVFFMFVFLRRGRSDRFRGEA